MGAIQLRSIDRSSGKDDEFQTLVERYMKNYRRLRRLISIQKTKPGHKLERKVYEAVVPRNKKPTSICEITGIT
jgi:hypothetical protein